MCDFWLPLRCERNLLYFGILSSVEGQFVTDVLEQPVGHILKGQGLKMGPIGCPETSVRNYISALRKIPKERRSKMRVTEHFNQIFWIEEPLHLSLCTYAHYYAEAAEIPFLASRASSC